MNEADYAGSDACGACAAARASTRDGGLGEGTFDLRVTDVHGHAVEDLEVVPGDGAVVDGAAQLPSCR